MDEKKSFDAVEMVHHIRDEHHDQLKDRTIEERIEHGTAHPRFRFLVVLTPRTQLPPNELLVTA